MSNPHHAAPSRDPFERALRWFGGLPRAGRWGVAAGLLMGGFLLLDSVIWPLADTYNARADRLTSLAKMDLVGREVSRAIDALGKALLGASPLRL